MTTPCFVDLETPRLLLRSIAPEDRDFIFRQFSNESVNRYLFDAEPMESVAEADDLIAFYRQPEPRAQHRWILLRKADGVPIGTCGFHCWSREHAQCEVGYDLLEAYRAQGYMTEAMQAVLAFARQAMGVRRVVACIYPQNESSVNLARRLGFAPSGEVRMEHFRGLEIPHDLYELKL